MTLVAGTGGRAATPTRAAGEQGAYLVLYALLATALFTMAAIVLDMTSLREDKRAAGLAADLAVTAGAALLDPASPSTIAAACQQAWDYFRANADDDTGTVVSPTCSDFTLTSCDPVLARTVTGSAGPYRVEITNPVPDASSLMRGEAGPGDTPQPANPAADGPPCDRLAVRILRTRTLAFAGVVGLGSGQVDVHAVARPTSPTSRVPSLVVTDPTACRTLVSASGGELRVGAGVSDRPGIVFVASDGSGCAGQYVVSAVDPVTSATGKITAVPATVPGVIHSAALAGAYPTTAYDPADTAAGRVSPVPSPPPPSSTSAVAFVTDRFNCTLAGCPVGSNPIGALRAALGGPGAPAGYVIYSSASSAHFGPATPPADVCNLSSTDPSPAFLATDNVFVDCPGGFSVANSVTFPANAVFSGGVVVRDGGCLAVRDLACGAASVSTGDGVVYLRSGDLVKEDGARLVLNQTFVHLTGSAASTTGGRLDAPPDTPAQKQLTWTAPLAGDFKNLLLWAESAGAMRLGGHGTFAAEGLLFAPNTTRFELHGLTGGTSAAMQLIAGRVELTSNHTFTIAPSPTPGRVITEQRRDVRLVR